MEKEVKNNTKYAFIIITAIVAVILIIVGILYSKNKKDMLNQNKDIKEVQAKATTTGVVVKVDERGLLVMETKNITDLFSVGFTNEGNIGFKQGQEILIYFDGMVMETYPAQLGKVEKIEIIKEKSDTQIPESILRYCYSSKNKVSVKVSELTSKGISFTITDTNNLKYNYSTSYTINRKVKNKNYTGVGYQIGENTGNSIAGNTRNRPRIFMGRSNKNFKYCK